MNRQYRALIRDLPVNAMLGELSTVCHPYSTKAARHLQPDMERKMNYGRIALATVGGMVAYFVAGFA